MPQGPRRDGAGISRRKMLSLLASWLGGLIPWLGPLATAIPREIKGLPGRIDLNGWSGLPAGRGHIDALDPNRPAWERVAGPAGTPLGRVSPDGRLLGFYQGETEDALALLAALAGEGHRGQADLRDL
jgi:hypothetical protein